MQLRVGSEALDVRDLDEVVDALSIVFEVEARVLHSNGVLDDGLADFVDLLQRGHLCRLRNCFAPFRAVNIPGSPAGWRSHEGERSSRRRGHLDSKAVRMHDRQTCMLACLSSSVQTHLQPVRRHLLSAPLLPGSRWAYPGRQESRMPGCLKEGGYVSRESGTQSPRAGMRMWRTY